MGWRAKTGRFKHAPFFLFLFFFFSSRSGNTEVIKGGETGEVEGRSRKNREEGYTTEQKQKRKSYLFCIFSLPPGLPPLFLNPPPLTPPIPIPYSLPLSLDHIDIVDTEIGLTYHDIWKWDTTRFPGAMAEVDKLARGRRRGRDDDSALSIDGAAAQSAGIDPPSANSPKKQRRRSRKGNSDKKFECKHEGCGKSYSRAEHLYRHQLNRV